MDFPVKPDKGHCGQDCYCGCHRTEVICLDCWPVGSIGRGGILRTHTFGIPSQGFYSPDFVHPLAGPAGPLDV